MRYILCIDQGTTSTKAFLLDEEGNLSQGTHVPFKQHYPQPGWVSHDAEEIYLSVLKAIAMLLKEHPEAKGSIVSMGITNQRETTVAFSPSGKPFTQAIVWQCRRTSDICRRPEIREQGRRITEITGLKIDPYFSATKMLWLLENIKGLRERCLSGEACLSTIDGFLVYRLTNGSSYASDYSNCSRTMLFDISKKAYDEEFLELFGIPVNTLAKPLESCADYGVIELDEEYLSSNGFTDDEIKDLMSVNGVHITGVLGDQPAALLGQNAINKGDSKTTYGTGSFTLMNLGTEPVFSKNGLLTSCAWSINGVTNYALEGSIFQAGSVISWLKDELGFIENPKDCDEFCNSIEDTGGVYLVPAFTGLGAPYWKPDARGVLTGLTRGTGRAQIIRAGVESIAYQVTELVNLMTDDTGIKAGQMKVDGGVCASSFLMQLQSDLLGVTITRALSDEMTAMGAGLAAGIQAGIFESVEKTGEFYKAGASYEPDMSAFEVSEKMEGYRSAVRATLLSGND
ncbi:MAG: glycerol kinase GlpK [Clostridiales bacterium]|nr:glycerol kinase GlpK [Clostridiales bacterium]